MSDVFDRHAGRQVMHRSKHPATFGASTTCFAQDEHA